MFWKWKPLFWGVSFLGIRTLMDRPDSHSWFSSTSTRVVSFRCIWPSMAVFKAWRDQENDHVSSIMPTDFTPKTSGKHVENVWKWLKKGVPHVPSTFHPFSFYRHGLLKLRDTANLHALQATSLGHLRIFHASQQDARAPPRGLAQCVHNVHSSQAIPFGDRLQCLCSARCRQSCHRTTSNRLGRVENQLQTARPPDRQWWNQTIWFPCAEGQGGVAFLRTPLKVSEDHHGHRWPRMGTRWHKYGWNRVEYVENFKVDRLVVCTTPYP